MKIRKLDTKKNKEIFQFDVPDITAESLFKTIYQFDDKCFVEIVNRAKEESQLVFPNTGDETSSDFKGDKTIIIVVNSNQQTIWRQEFEGENIKSLIIEELKQIIAFYNEDPFSSTISLFDLNTGNEISKIKVEKASLLSASLDFNNNINAILHFDNNEIMLRNYYLDGKVNWEYTLPISSVEYLNQPPAINRSNQVFCLINSKIFAIDRGKLIWELSIPEDEYFKFLTITGDNNLLIGSSYLLNYIDSNGQLIFNYLLDQNERITTPPVVDEKGLIYFGSTKGIYNLK
jgi:outer membrane protein assembly factor BamB